MSFIKWPSPGKLTLPQIPKAVQPGGVYTSFIDANLVRMTEALHSDGLLTRKSYCYPFPGGAPTLVTSGINSAETFQMPPTDDTHAGVDLSLPWCSHPGVVRIYAEIKVATFSKYTGFAVQLRASTFISSVSTATGAAVELTDKPTPLWGQWLRNGEIASVRTALVAVEPNYPADRRIALNVLGSYIPTTEGSSQTIERKAKIVSMRIYDDSADPVR